jgi:hypothetical protein
VEAEAPVGLEDLVVALAQHAQRQQIQLAQLVVLERVARGLEVVEVRQQVPAGVADLAVRLAELVEDGLGEHDVAW